MLMRDDLRRDYDAITGQARTRFRRDCSDIGYSSWKGPLRSHALFVDANACIGHFFTHSRKFSFPNSQLIRGVCFNW